ncbi:hypothetical protein GCM10017771_87770 [Streptomyces capitiformicae]|uniref:Uncharacterized protein n=2 Tax=Streptomyces capitiformicae TaxID=2014920 RepID=A0A918ZPY4_9ACTN|nr:hypothetical protein GCM10017771_87770 [Streptomyces capitiformicae]
MSDPEEHMTDPESAGEVLPDEELDAIAGGDAGRKPRPPYL